MLRAMIVEDNAVYRFAIRTIIDWGQCGFEPPVEAVNGKQALSCLAESPVDLIVTDISMPEMNGIELIQQVKRIAPDTEIVVLSSYDDFPFVRNALKLGAADYLLKHDLEPENLVLAVMQAKEKLEERSKASVRDPGPERVRQWLYQLLTRSVTLEEAERQAEAALLPHRRSAFVMLSAVVRETESPEGHASTAAPDFGQLDPSWLVISLGRGRYAVYLDFKDEKSEARMLAAAYEAAEGISRAAGRSGAGCRIGISRAGFGVKTIEALHKQAEAAVFRSVYDEEEDGRIYSAPGDRPYRDTVLAGSYPSLAKALKNGEIEACEALADRLFRDMRVVKPPEGELRKLLLDLFALLVAAASDQGAELAPMDHWQGWVTDSLARLSPLERIREAVLERIRSVCAGSARERPEIKQAKSYIMKHLDEELNVADLSRRLDLSPNYLSILFRQQTGQRLSEFIQQCRMEEAKRLLRETTLKVYETASKVGYKDTSYFCKVFKEYAGMTVSDYRGSTQPVSGFQAESFYLLINRNSGMALDVDSDSLAEGAGIIQWHQHGEANQCWMFVPAGGDAYKLVNRRSGLLLGVDRGSAEGGAGLVQEADGGRASQRWRIMKSGSYYKLVNAGSGLLADVNGGDKTPCARIIQWKDTMGANQQWDIVKMR
ncbi:RICIN domain-containing protein [Paenibacillus methanolicus]|uniref:YesN/AraC family two-component response regulator n=1 Tax=Paenibacillus methanolicus TaxID=582686 RepID=A0A5S5CJF5_9BACL|nr:RICIN domain-containing protein [Paenibacillus methanolicus]TYP79870.1 YesN/AraC family two-component response regulator [Paenibacillus methanolicus]